MSKVLLINPNSTFVAKHRLYKQFLPPIAPLGLAYIAACLEKDKNQVKIIDLFTLNNSDSQLLEFIRQWRPEVIGFSVLTPAVTAVKILVHQIRAIDKGIKVVFGNSHASYFAHELLQEGVADIIVRGEGERIMAELCRAIDNPSGLSGIKGISYSSEGKIFHNPEGNYVEDLSELPLPAFHLLDLSKYTNFPMLSIYNKRFLPISASRGCPYKCYFCSQDSISKKPRYRNMRLVIDEIEYMHNKFHAQYFCFTDAYFPFSESTCYEFCEGLLRRNLNKKIRWCTESRVDQISPRMIKQMRESGLHLIMYGIEVGNREVLAKSNKQATLEQAREAIRYTKEANVLSLGLFILGLPGETKKTCLETIKFAKEIDPDIAKFNIAIPYPGSQFFNDYMKNLNIDIPESYMSWHSAFSSDMVQGQLPFRSQSENRELAKLQRIAMIQFYLRPRVIIRYILRRIVTLRTFFYGAWWVILMIFLGASDYLSQPSYREDKSKESYNV